MGADFISKRNKSYKKHIDRKRVALATSDLLTQTPNNKPRRVSAKLKQGVNLSIGDEMIIQKYDQVWVCRCGNKIVAEIKKLPSTIASAISESCGIAVGVVEKIREMSDEVEVSVR